MLGRSREIVPAAAVFLLLTLLVWGLFAFDRGPWQDDVAILAATKAQTAFRVRFFSPITTPTRVLVRIPYALALLTRSPVTTLQAFYGGLWLLSGALSAMVLLELFPGRRWPAYLGGCVTICATSDFLVDSLVSLPYEISAACFFGAFLALHRAWKSENGFWMIPSALLLWGSVWTTDTAFASIILAPVWLWIGERFRFTRRRFWILCAWYAAFTPYLVVFIRFLFDPHGYAAFAILPASLCTRIGRTMRLFGNNFEIWNWGFDRKNWFPAFPRLLPIELGIGLAGFAVAVFLAVGIKIYRSAESPAETPPPARRTIAISLGGCLILALASNATFALVQNAEYFYRTQIMSRYWVSIGVAIAAYAIAQRSTVLGVAFGIPALFVGFGVLGGLDRQDYFLGQWRRHREELRSIVETIPKLRRRAIVVFRIFGDHPHMATDTAYLLQSWLDLLSGGTKFPGRSFLWADVRGARCSAEAGTFVCSEDSSSPPERFPLDRTLVLDYGLEENRYRLVLREEFPRIAGVEKPGDYRPKRLIFRGSPPASAVPYLYRREGLARFLPDRSLSSGGKR